VLLVSKWDSKWQWDMFVNNSVEFATESDQLDVFLVEPQDILVQRELAREPEIQSFAKQLEAQRRQQTGDSDVSAVTAALAAGRKVHVPMTVSQLLSRICAAFALLVAGLMIALLWYASRTSTPEMVYKERMQLDFGRLADAVYTPTWYQDHWYNSWDEHLHRSPEALRARPLSSEPMVVKPLEILELENLEKAAQAAKDAAAAGDGGGDAGGRRRLSGVREPRGHGASQKGRGGL
jgi:hypothetical protein